jgi:hypothetical protein
MLWLVLTSIGLYGVISYTGGAPEERNRGLDGARRITSDYTARDLDGEPDARRCGRRDRPAHDLGSDAAHRHTAVWRRFERSVDDRRCSGTAGHDDARGGASSSSRVERGSDGRSTNGVDRSTRRGYRPAGPAEAPDTSARSLTSVQCPTDGGQESDDRVTASVRISMATVFHLPASITGTSFASRVPGDSRAIPHEIARFY